MSLETDPFILDLKANIKESIDSMSLSVSRGNCSGFDVYKSVTGKIEGLRLAIDIINNCMKNYARDDDDD